MELFYLWNTGKKIQLNLTKLYWLFNQSYKYVCQSERWHIKSIWSGHYRNYSVISCSTENILYRLVNRSTVENLIWILFWDWLDCEAAHTRSWVSND